MPQKKTLKMHKKHLKRQIIRQSQLKYRRSRMHSKELEKEHQEKKEGEIKVAHAFNYEPDPRTSSKYKQYESEKKLAEDALNKANKDLANAQDDAAKAQAKRLLKVEIDGSYERQKGLARWSGE